MPREARTRRTGLSLKVPAVTKMAVVVEEVEEEVEEEAEEEEGVAVAADRLIVSFFTLNAM